MTRKITAIFTALAMVLSLLPAGALPSWAADTAPMTYDISKGSVGLPDDSEKGDCPGHIITGSSDEYAIFVTGGSHRIILQDVRIDRSEGTDAACAFDISDGKVDLILKGENSFVSGEESAGIRVRQDDTLNISGDGSLTATGSNRGGAGIGGSYRAECGNIHISGGTITAIGQGGGAGIGGGCGDEYYNQSGGTIEISGGTVIATGSNGSDDIGSGASNQGDAGTFSTGENGNAVIFADTIGDKSAQSSWRGIFFEGNTGKVYGNPTLQQNLEIPDGKTLTVPAGTSLTVPAGKTLTIPENSTLTVDGTFELKGKLDGDGQITPKLSASITDIKAEDKDYDGKEIDVTYTYNGNGTVDETWYADDNGSRGDKLGAAPTDAGTYWLGLSAEATGFYQAVPEQTKQVTITPAPLNGNVEISGEPAFGKTLTATYTENEPVTFQWQRNGQEIATGKSYELTAEDVNQKIRVVAIPANNNYSGTVSSTELTVSKAQESVPNLSIINETESVTIPAGYSYKLDNAEWTPCTEQTTVTVAPKQKISIRKDETATHSASPALELTAPERGKTPNLAIDNASESVTIPAGYSYKLGEAGDWTPCKDETPVKVEPKQRISIRKDFTNDNYASIAQELTAPVRQDTPNLAIDNTSESVTIPAGHSYKLGEATDWTPCDKDTTVTVAPEQKISIRKNATTTEYASDPQALTAPSRLDAPTTVVGSINTLSGLSTDMEYSRDGKTWTAVKGASMDLTAGDYYVRFKATTDNFASESVKVTVKPYSGKYSYETSVTQPEHGKISVDKYVTEGETVTITVTPDDGYAVDSVSVTDKRGKTVDVTKNSDGTYSFTMPKGNVTITATFVESDEPEPEPQPEPSALPFTDVNADAWYIDPVRFVYSEGLMTGTSATEFSPNLTTTRGMIVAILYRMEGEPDLSGENLGYPFADVDTNAYYGDAVYWARLNGIVSGYSSDAFGPTDSITREQLAAILYNYAEYKGVDTSARNDLSSYDDSGSISGWATDAMQWANAEGIVNGMSASELAPKGNATRAQVAAMLERYIKNALT